MEKVVKIFIYVFGIICGIAFFSIRFPSLFNSLVEDKMVSEHWEFVKWGELYYFNFINDFKIEGFPEAKEKFRNSDKNASFDEADILTFGDSFFDFARYKNISERLSEHFGAKVRHTHNDHPLNVLFDADYKKQKKKKYLIYETVERNINQRFGDPNWLHVVPTEKSKPVVESVKDKTLGFLFPKERENLYSQLLGRSYITKDITTAFNTMKFHWFGYLSQITPMATIEDPEDPFIFYHREVSKDTPFGFYFQHSDSLINNYCDNILMLKENLEKEYNLELIFVITPNKYTLYHTKMNNDKYNELIPRVQKGLKKRGVKYVDLYGVFMEHVEKGEMLYHGTDTHWNGKGIELGFNELLKVMKTEFPVADSTDINPKIN